MTALAPLEVKFTERELMLAEALGKDRGMLALVRQCPECEGLILVPDNGVWLDAKPLEPGHEVGCPMGIMKMGTLNMACSTDPGTPGSQHRIHDHQPEEGD